VCVRVCVCVVHAVLLPMCNILYILPSTFQSMCTVFSMAFFFSSLVLCFLGTLIRYFMNNFEIVPVADIVTGILVLHSRCAVFLL
jgi:hypothetical protein